MKRNSLTKGFDVEAPLPPAAKSVHGSKVNPGPVIFFGITIEPVLIKGTDRWHYFTEFDTMFFAMQNIGEAWTAVCSTIKLSSMHMQAGPLPTPALAAKRLEHAMRYFHKHMRSTFRSSKV